MAAKAGAKTRTRELPMLWRRATFAPESLNDDARTVDLIWTTGAKVERRGYFEDFIEELSLDPDHVRMEFLEGGDAPLLDAHISWSNKGVIGNVLSARLDGDKGVATVRFLSGGISKDADELYGKVKDGVLRNVSVGYHIHEIDLIPGEEEGDLPTYRAVDWEPLEISIVPIGADLGAQVRAAGAAPTKPCLITERTMAKSKKKPSSGTPATPAAAPPSVRAEDEEASEDEEERADEEETTEDEESSDESEEERADDDSDEEESERSAAASGERRERRRVGAIHRTALALGLDAEFVSKHVERGTPADKFRRIAIDKRAKDKEPTVSDVRISSVPGGDARDKFLRGAGDWLIQRAAVANMVVADAKKRGEDLKLDPGEFRGMSLADLARACLERSGVRTAGMLKRDLFAAALTQRSGGMASTGDFPVLLENVLHKTLLASYGMTPDTWSRFCAVGTVSDFRVHNRYRVGTFGRLDIVNEHGEFANKGIPDGEKESIYAVTKGNIIAITRQALINDDLGAFTSLATRFGRAARLSIEADVYDLLALNGGLGPDMGDGNPLFDAAHGNIGDGSVLSVAGLDEDRVLMAMQTAPNAAGDEDEFLDLRPAVLVVATALGGQAKVINQSTWDIDQGTQFQTPNKVAGLFQDIVDTPRMSGTRRYLFADPSIAPTLEVAFLEGQQTPYMESKDGWRVDGTEFKVRLDYGVGGVDFRGAVTNEGVAEES